MAGGTVDGVGTCGGVTMAMPNAPLAAAMLALPRSQPVRRVTDLRQARTVAHSLVGAGHGDRCGACW